MTTPVPKRGDIYTVEFGRVEGLLRKARPAVVIQNDIGNEFAPHTIVAAIRSAAGKPDLPIFVPVPKGVAGLGKDSIIDCGHLATVGRDQLGSRWGRLPPDYERRLDEALRESLDL
jgi:mRNA interferase MazF